MFRHVRTTVATGVRRRLAPAQRALSSAAPAAEFDMSASFRHSEQTGFIRTSPYQPIELPGLRIDQFVWQHVERWQSHTAVISGETDRAISYAQLRDQCAAVAVRLQQRREFGLQAGDVVALCLPNTPDFPIACLGVIEAGLTVTSVNPVYTADEIAKQLIASAAKVLIGTVDGHATLRKAIQLSQLPIHLVCVRAAPDQPIPADCIDFAQLADPAGVDFASLRQPDGITPDSVAFLPFSSGTTGLPKGVRLSHNNIVANCLQINQPLPIERIVEDTTATHQDVLPSVLPYFHIYGFTVLLASKLALGCKAVTLSQFVPETFLKSLTVHRGNLVHLVPPIVNFLAGHPAVKKEHMQFMKSAMCGAAPISESDVERFMAKVDRPIDFMQGYGMTETSPAILITIKQNRRYSSSGGPTPSSEAKICAVDDPRFRGLGPNESGELLVRGPQVMLGYHNNEAATAETLLPGGWLRTGDVAHYDEQGYFHVTDRLKELIKVKGFQVPPAELEALLRTHPLVGDAAVLGVPHAISGEVPVAFVVRRPGADAQQQVSEDELKQFVAEKVAAFKRLEGGVRFVEAIPKNATGKILRRELKQLYGLE